MLEGFVAPHWREVVFLQLKVCKQSHMSAPPPSSALFYRTQKLPVTLPGTWAQITAWETGSADKSPVLFYHSTLPRNILIFTITVL